MADYNIYIHAFSGESSPTSPFQLRGGSSDEGGVEGSAASGGDAFGLIRRASSFIQNPDSAIGKVANTASGALMSGVGKIGIAIFAVGALLKITKSVADKYIAYSTSATGDYAFQIKYNNFFQVMHNALHPVSNEIQRQYTQLEIIKRNQKVEQERLLFGGTIYTDKYGRNL